jgi:acetyl-CoA carboxylase beta subunit
MRTNVDVRDAGDQFSMMSAAERAAALVDPGTLEALEREAAAQSTVWVGRGRMGGEPVLLALTDGASRGGTVGIHEAGVLARAVARAASEPVAALIVCWDTGGVRVDEGPVALAAASAVGVALARLSLIGPALLTVISGRRGCFGAPSVMAALSQPTILTENARWGLTGPKLLRTGGEPAAEDMALVATSAVHRFEAGHAGALVPDSASALRARLMAVLAKRPRRLSVARALERSFERTTALLERAERPEETPPMQRAGRPHERDLLRFSFRGQWRPTGPVVRRGLVHAAWGLLNDRPAMGIIVGYSRRRDAGIGIEEAKIITEMVRFAVRESGGEPAPIFTFLFCQGHAVELSQETFGLPCALAECLRSFVAARLLGHPLLCVLGGGAYGAAYLSLAAPSHRVLAIRGTSVAPMAPKVLTAFRRLRGLREAAETPPNLAELIPEIRIVETVVRLPRALREELDTLLQSVRPMAGRGRRRR